MTIYDDPTSAYIQRLFAPEDEALIKARQDSPQKGLIATPIVAEEGRFLQFLVRACAAQKVLEIGTLGGYSGIWLARGLPAGGKLITLEIEPLHAQVALEHFALAGVADRVEVRVGDAHLLLETLEAEGPFDLVFIDAEKPGLPQYLDWALLHTRLGGVIAVHNAFRRGKVVGLVEPDQFTGLMQDFNRRFAQETRLISSVFPAGDGTLLGVKVAG